MRLTYDATTDVAYLELRPLDAGDVMGPALLLEPDRAFHAMVIADFVELDGMLVGLEFVRASRCLPAALLATAERIDGRNLAHRFEARCAGRASADPPPRARVH